MYTLTRLLPLLLLTILSTGCDCCLFGKSGDNGQVQSAGGASGDTGGGGTGGGGGGGGGGTPNPQSNNPVPEIDPTAVRGGLVVLVCGTLLLVDRRWRGHSTAGTAA